MNFCLHREVPNSIKSHNDCSLLPSNRKVTYSLLRGSFWKLRIMCAKNIFHQPRMFGWIQFFLFPIDFFLLSRLTFGVTVMKFNHDSFFNLTINYTLFVPTQQVLINIVLKMNTFPYLILHERNIRLYFLHTHGNKLVSSLYLHV